MFNSKPPIVYQASPKTGEYIGQSFADPDPLVEGNWLIPGKAFTEAPPNVETGFAAVHVPGHKDTWSILEDLRGVAYKTDNGSPVVWEAFGPLPDGLTSVAPPSPYYVWLDGGWKLDIAAENEGLKLEANAIRDGLLRHAATRIAPLQDAVDLGDATSIEEDVLKNWKQYRVALNRIDQQSGYPVAIDWPKAPDSAA
ncbi:tail fiber assembly protein [Pseudomonas tolaasii]|uniref:tail fiber assembly protein n=1 Tax=Pseudomonas tolaasii TaxID=29442 RepID=UPI0030CF48A0